MCRLYFLFFEKTKRDISYGWVPIERRYHGFLYLQGVFFSGATGTRPAARDHNIIISGATLQSVYVTIFRANNTLFIGPGALNNTLFIGSGALIIHYSSIYRTRCANNTLFIGPVAPSSAWT